jgi:hypothetical protein
MKRFSEFLVLQGLLTSVEPCERPECLLLKSEVWLPEILHKIYHEIAYRCLQIQRISANMSNKQLWTAEKVSSSSLGVGRGAKNPSP